MSKPDFEWWFQNQAKFNLKRIGNELKGPCPNCGGIDRFWVKLDGVFGCRKCNDFEAILKASGRWEEPKIKKSKPKTINPFDTAEYVTNNPHWWYSSIEGNKVMVEFTGRDDKNSKIMQVHGQKEGDIFHPLHHDKIDPHKNLIICEGETCCDLLRSEGLNATTWKGGCKAVHKTNWNCLKDFKQEIILWPDMDTDNGGLQAIESIALAIIDQANYLSGFKIVVETGVKHGWDCEDCRDAYERMHYIDTAISFNPPRNVELETYENVEDGADTWLILDWVPFGEITLLGGDAKRGKSTWSQMMAAAITRGFELLGDDEVQTGRVLIWSGEDRKRRIKASLQACNADLSKVVYTTIARDREGKKVEFNPAEHLNQLKLDLLRFKDIVCIILDPVIVVSSNVKEGASNDPNTLRNALEELRKLVEDTGVACIGIHHFKKKQGKNTSYSIMDQFIGSSVWVQIARHLLVVGKKPDEEKLVIMNAESNLIEAGGGFEYAIKSKLVKKVENPSRRNPHIYGKTVEIGQYFKASAEDILLSEKSNNATIDNAVQIAMDFMQEYLATKEAYTLYSGISIFEIYREGKEQDNIAKSNFDKAKGILKKNGLAMTKPYNGQWVWWLTGKEIPF